MVIPACFESGTQGKVIDMCDQKIRETALKMLYKGAQI
jgi:hypothetical protein